MRWRNRFGLQARMTASYVLVTATAVLVVEAIAIGVILPSYLADQDLNNRVAYTAGNLAERVGIASLSSTQVTLPPGFTLGDPATLLGPGQVLNEGQGLVVPQVTHAFAANDAPLTLAVLYSTQGVILASSYPARYPAGSSSDELLSVTKKVISGPKSTTTDTSSGGVAWAVQPVRVQLSQNRGVVPPGSSKLTAPDAYVYVQAPVHALTFLSSLGDVQPLLQAGLIVLLLALPVGALFGLLTTRGMVKRLRRLAGSTSTVAEGDFSRRLVPGSSDELGRLEHNFNEMSARLASALDRERGLANQSARQAERSRISRELHDSISQDLFSISLLAAGLEKALPDRSPLRREVRALVETSEATNREMRALLLELRPATLDEKGLVPALEELASNYSSRLGIKVDTDLEAVRMAPATELAALRIAQEGLANAVKHAQATSIKLGLHSRNGHADITVADDGKGFDPDAGGAVEGFGLRLMRERVEELGGSMSIDSGPGKGTVISASIPRATA
jgi:signal transduction histidine kinase